MRVPLSLTRPFHDDVLVCDARSLTFWIMYV